MTQCGHCAKTDSCNMLWLRHKRLVRRTVKQQNSCKGSHSQASIMAGSERGECPCKQCKDLQSCLPVTHELESLHRFAQFLTSGFQLLVHTLSLVDGVCNLLQISFGNLQACQTELWHQVTLGNESNTVSNSSLQRKAATTQQCLYICTLDRCNKKECFKPTW